MVTRKMLINESHKYFTNVSFHISTIRVVEPNNLSLASLTLEWTWNICDIFIKSTIFKSNGNGIFNWNIAMKSQKYVCGSRKCDLCICEKLLISRADPDVLLNKRDELVSKCRHRNKFTLKCFKDR